MSRGLSIRLDRGRDYEFRKVSPFRRKRRPYTRLGDHGASSSISFGAGTLPVEAAEHVQHAHDALMKASAVLRGAEIEKSPIPSRTNKFQFQASSFSQAETRTPVPSLGCSCKGEVPGIVLAVFTAHLVS